MSFLSGIGHFLGNTLGSTLGLALGGPLGGILGKFAGNLIGGLFDKVTDFFLDKVGDLAAKFLPNGEARDIFEDAYQSAFKSSLAI